MLIYNCKFKIRTFANRSDLCYNPITIKLGVNVQYKQQGDYLIPCIRTKKRKEIHLGVLANRHRQYPKQSHKVLYYNLLMSEKLYDYLADIEKQAENMFLRLVDELAEKEGITEALKADNAME